MSKKLSERDRLIDEMLQATREGSEEIKAIDEQLAAIEAEIEAKRKASPEYRREQMAQSRAAATQRRDMVVGPIRRKLETSLAPESLNLAIEQAKADKSNRKGDARQRYELLIGKLEALRFAKDAEIAAAIPKLLNDVRQADIAEITAVKTPPAPGLRTTSFNIGERVQEPAMG
jgi:hypothetical protein